MQTGRVKSRQPHIAHQHNIQRIGRIAEPLRQSFTPWLVADMRLPVARIGRRAGHHNFDLSLAVIFIMPFRTQAHEFAIKINTYPIDKIVLAAVCLIGNNHNIAPYREPRMGVPLLFREKLLNSSKYHAPGRHRQFLTQISAVARLCWRLTQQILTTRKRAKELIIEIVAIRQNDNRRILHRRIADNSPGIKSHSQTLTRPLRMPHHANALIARRSTRLLPRFITSAPFRTPTPRMLQFHRSPRLTHSHPHRVELVITRHLLRQRTAAIILKNNKIAHQRKKTPEIADTFEHHLQFGHV